MSASQATGRHSWSREFTVLWNRAAQMHLQILGALIVELHRSAGLQLVTRRPPR